MGSKISKVGQQLSTQSQLAAKNSFKVFETQEYEVPAIDFERLGINTLHPKDRTVIEDLSYAHSKSVIGEIWPGEKCTVSEVSDGGSWINRTINKDEIINHESTDKVYHIPTKVEHVAFGVDHIDINSQLIDNHLPEFIYARVIHKTSVSAGTEFTRYIPRGPVLGVATIAKARVSNGPYRNDLTATFISSQYDIVDKDTTCIHLHNTIISMANSNYNNLGTNVKANADQVLYANDSIATTPFCSGLAPRQVAAFRVSGKSGPSGIDTIQYFIKYRIIPVTPMILNSEPATLEADSITQVIGKQHFYAIPEEICTTVGAYTIGVAIDLLVQELDTIIWEPRSEATYYTKYLGQALASSIHLVSEQTSSSGKYYLAIENDGTFYSPSNSVVLENSLSGIRNVNSPDPGQVNVNSIKTIDRSLFNDSETHVVDFSFMGAEIVSTVSKTKASTVCPLAYANAAIVPFDPYIVSHNVLSKNGGTCTVTKLDRTTVPVYHISGNSAFVRNTGCNLPTNKDFDSVLFMGSESSIEVSNKLSLKATFGIPSMMFSPDIYTNAHVESYSVSSLYSRVDLFPVLFPSFNLFSSIAIANYAPDLRYFDYGTETRTGLSLAPAIDYQSAINIKTTIDHHIGWCNSMSASREVTAISLKYELFPTTGTIMFCNLPKVDRYGTPEQVMFASDAIGAEFLYSDTVQCSNPIATSSGKYVATKSAIYSPSNLYLLSTAKMNEVEFYGKAQRGYQAVAQFIFVSSDDVSHIYAEDRNGPICVGSVHGRIIGSPIITVGGVILASIESSVAALYSINQGSIVPIKRIEYTGEVTAFLKFITGIGLVFAIHSGSNMKIYLISDNMASLVLQKSGVQWMSWNEYTGLSRLEFASGTKTYTISGMEPNGSFYAKSSDFCFPLIEGLKCVLVGMKLCFDSSPIGSFSLTVKANGRIVKTLQQEPCKVENIVIFDRQYPVGSGSYTISNCTGKLRNVSWIVSPMPIVQEDIAQPGGGTLVIDKTPSPTGVVATVESTADIRWVASATPDGQSPIVGFEDLITTSPYPENHVHTINVPVGEFGNGDTLYLTAQEVGTGIPPSTTSQALALPVPDAPIIALENGLSLSYKRTFSISKVDRWDHAIVKIAVDGKYEDTFKVYSTKFEIDLRKISGSSKEGTCEVSACVVVDGIQSEYSSKVQIEYP